MTDTLSTPARPPRRPFGLYAIIVIQLLLALLSMVLLALAGVAIFVAAAAAEAGATLDDLDLNLNISDLVTLALMVVVNLICVIGLWRRRRWAWFLTMLQLGAFMLSDLYSYFTGDPPATYAWSMLLNVVMVFYLNQREVQALFMHKPDREATNG